METESANTFLLRRSIRPPGAQHCPTVVSYERLPAQPHLHDRHTLAVDLELHPTLTAWLVETDPAMWCFAVGVQDQSAHISSRNARNYCSTRVAPPTRLANNPESDPFLLSWYSVHFLRKTLLFLASQ